jgi:hypothetical protein
MTAPELAAWFSEFIIPPISPLKFSSTAFRCGMRELVSILAGTFNVHFGRDSETGSINNLAFYCGSCENSEDSTLLG